LIAFSWRQRQIVDADAVGHRTLDHEPVKLNPRAALPTTAGAWPAARPP